MFPAERGQPIRVRTRMPSQRRVHRCWSLLLGSHRLGSRSVFRRADEQLIQRLTAEYFPAGYTILAAKGGWYDAATRAFIRESTRQILVTTPDAARVRRWARALGQALRQKETLLIAQGSVQRILTRDRDLPHTGRKAPRF